MTLTATASPAHDPVALQRAQIDAIDQELLALIARRMQHAAAIGQFKALDGRTIRQPARETEIVAGLCARPHGLLQARHVAAIWHTLFRVSRELQQVPSVAFLGPPGTFTEAAMQRYFGAPIRPHACDTLEATFAALAAANVDHAVVPIENSTEGTVTRAIDLLADATAPVVGEIVLPVAHCLLSASGTLEGVDCVLGHQQALAQCRAWLDAHAPQLRRVPVASNAAAAREAASMTDCAAIAGERAADRYGLRIVANAIQDEPGNRTRFLVLGGPPAEPTGHDRTSLLLKLDDTIGALAGVFDALARHRISVLWLDARPGRAAGWAYRFFVDIDGHQDDAHVRAALDDIRTTAADLRILGSYPRAPSVDAGAVAEPSAT
ncbi:MULTISPECIES: prephenate dehydratase [Burkholderia]|uniref:prephenate dehydratase n=1 Tax=Burkholderia TaxID=32008 RepID=UPI00064F8EA7|nr:MULTISPECIES: prephenate dehydratase [Burkholderia]KML21599.1 chorismate mutase [Burkholderia cepacia]KMN60666.1 chorismate mutase [Burkholderia sp. LK4]